MSDALRPRNATQSVPPQSGRATARQVPGPCAEIPIRWIDVRIESPEGAVA